MEKPANYIKRAKDLEVYKRAYAVSLDVHKATLAFPKIEQYALADQLRRSGKGICANLAEGFAKQTHSRPEFAAKRRRGYLTRSIWNTSAERNETSGCKRMRMSTAC
ncbi:four helix bundle protein [Mesorhizobium sp. M0276]|uniref:four helix bundle protein n=1 Tax=Mesorhizobium sp. M0276 TaxID=2956928 RepID=UPI00333776CA